MLPGVVGIKLMKSVHVPGASEPGAAVVPSGHVELPPSTKFVEMLGSVPVVGINVSAALPMFSSSSVCGLSLLVLPTLVDAKLRLGGVAREISFTRLLF
jgi:hypothetical protein